MKGFTLVEVVVALAVGGLVVLGAAGLFLQLAGGADRVQALAWRADREANAERLLRDVVGRIEPSAGREPSLVGDRRSARFSSWCDVPPGWQERCAATLSVRRASNGRAYALLLELSTGESVELLDDRSPADLLYLTDPARGGTWLTEWRSVTTPLALGIARDADTLILRIGERG